MQNNNLLPEKSPNTSLESISSSLTKASQILNNYILSPIQKLGLAGFLFDKTVNSNVTTKTQYTNNYVEKGAFITDHSITEPKKISITGYVGEKVYSQQENKNLLNKLAEKLPVILSATPKLTAGMQQLKNSLDATKKQELQNSINANVDFWNILKSLIPAKTKVGKAYNYLEALRLSRAILSLTEPDGTYHTDMVITEIKKTTREDTLDIVDFIVELQEFRTADTIYAAFNLNNFAGRAKEQKAQTANYGTTQGIKTNETPQGMFEHITNRTIKSTQ